MTPPTPAPLLTDNDRRFLDACERAGQEGVHPRGSAEWTAERRLARAGLVEHGPVKSAMHNYTNGIVLTDAGKRVLHPEEFDP